VFFDYDRDGLPDLLVSRYVMWDFSRDDWCGERKPGYRAYCHPDHYAPIPHLLYRNLGGGKFEDVSKKSGIGESPGKGLGVALNDYDGNGWVDVAIANDSFPQQFFRNNGDGTFTEDGLLSGMAYDADGNTYAGMGIDFADYDNDGRPDIFVNALANQKYALYRASEAGFDYVTGPSGVGAITMLHSGWGTRFVDYDNDGWRDLFVVQGHVMDNIELTQPSVRYLEPPVLMRNVKGRFEDVSKSSGEPFGVAIAGRGAAFADLDNDGYVDVAINVNDGPAVLLRNEGGSGHHWLGLRLTGVKSNRDAVGAVVRIEPEQGPAQTGMVSAAGSYLSSNDPRLHFGLGPAKSVKRLEIRWPSGARQVLEDVAADRYLEVSEP
jgi:enediyne biosynthesis protein E4